MAEVRAKWLAFYSEHVEPVSKEIFSHVEKLIIGTLIVSAGAHVSSSEPAIVLFGYLRHGLIGRGVMLFGVILLLLNFVDGLYKLARLNWHIAYQTVMAILDRKSTRLNSSHVAISYAVFCLKKKIN